MLIAKLKLKIAGASLDAFINCFRAKYYLGGNNWKISFIIIALEHLAFDMSLLGAQELCFHKLVW